MKRQVVIYIISGGCEEFFVDNINSVNHKGKYSSFNYIHHSSHIAEGWFESSYVNSEIWPLMLLVF